MSPILTSPLNNELITAFRESGSDDRLRSLREEAMGHFEKLGLPGSKNEEYRFTPVTRSLEKDFSARSLTEYAASSLDNVNQFLIPDYEANLVVLINGRYREQFSRIISPEGQVRISPLRVAVEEGSPEVLEYFNRLMETKSDPFAALNAALWQDGVFIRVPDQVVVEKPIVILHIHDAREQTVASHTRHLVVLGENSEARIIEKFDSIGDNQVFSSLVEEIVVGIKGRLEYCRIQNDPGAVNQITNTLIRQSNSSRVNTFTIAMNGQIVRNNFGIAIDGEKCESHFYGLYLLDKNTLVDNHTVVDHRKPNSFSNELYKGIMNGKSKGVFNGKIYVRPHAQKTNAFQSNRNILLSDTATVNTKPQLEIWADDVKCSHGCTAGQLDEEALFYLRSRGISKKSGQAMLLYAFAGEIIQSVRDVQLKAYLDKLISERLDKNLIS